MIRHFAKYRAKNRDVRAGVGESNRRHGQHRWHQQSGLTLIELMVALLISSLLIGLVFAIYTRMSVAYRGQSGMSDVQQVLRAAQHEMARHVRNAGHLVPQGFNTSAAVRGVLGEAGNPVPAVRVFNDDGNDGANNFTPDKIRVFYGDATAMARITAITGTTITVDDVDTFKSGDLILVVGNVSFTGNDALDAGAELAEYNNVCVFKLNLITGNDFDLSNDGHYNNHDAVPCALPYPNTTVAVGSMVYRFVGRSFRIDPDPTPKIRKLAALQVSHSGESAVAADWQIMGAGFTDLQFAQRYWMKVPPGTDLDGDGDASHDWFSGSVAAPLAPDAHLVEVSISLVVRTTTNTNAVPTSATPDLSDANINHNRLGDSPSFDLLNTPDAARPVHLQGDHIYRWSSMRVDLRNMGVGR